MQSIIPSADFMVISQETTVVVSAYIEVETMPLVRDVNYHEVPEI